MTKEISQAIANLSNMFAKSQNALDKKYAQKTKAITSDLIITEDNVKNVSGDITELYEFQADLLEQICLDELGM